jgi:hypothetical protein
MLERQQRQVLPSITPKTPRLQAAISDGCEPAGQPVVFGITLEFTRDLWFGFTGIPHFTTHIPTSVVSTGLLAVFSFLFFPTFTGFANPLVKLARSPCSRLLSVLR